jgi:hypothetical protein
MIKDGSAVQAIILKLSGTLSTANTFILPSPTRALQAQDGTRNFLASRGASELALLQEARLDEYLL